MSNPTTVQAESSSFNSTPTKAVTPGFFGWLRNNVFWIVAFFIVLALAAITLFSTGAMANTQRLNPENPKPQGAKALFQVLEQQGIHTKIVTSLDQLKTELTDPANSTVLLHDRLRILQAEKLGELATVAKHLVLLEPNYWTLDTLAPGVLSAGKVNVPLAAASCQDADAIVANAITGSGFHYSSDDPSWSGCYETQSDRFLVFSKTVGGQKITVFGAGDAITNEKIILDGNATVALRLLGQNKNLIWYIPGIDDQPKGKATLADLTPNWVPAVMILAWIVLFLAGFWRGRRQGPLVAENLPVVVPANETATGRARLYGRADARLRSIDYLRMGTITRLNKSLNLASTATVAQTAERAASMIGSTAASLAPVLITARPGSDQDLIKLSDELTRLEKAVAEAVRIRGN